MYVEFDGFLGESFVMEEVDREPPHKIDENMWKNREHIEEIIFLLDRPHWPITVLTKLYAIWLAISYRFLKYLWDFKL